MTFSEVILRGKDHSVQASLEFGIILKRQGKVHQVRARPKKA